MMEGRRFSDGLHQALEAKENVSIKNENQTLASVTFQNYFRIYLSSNLELKSFGIMLHAFIFSYHLLVHLIYLQHSYYINHQLLNIYKIFIST